MGCHIFISFDSIAYSQGTMSFPETLLFALHRKGYFTWDHLITDWCGPVPLWKDDVDLFLPINLCSSWNAV